MEKNADKMDKVLAKNRQLLAVIFFFFYASYTHVDSIVNQSEIQKNVKIF